MDAFHSDETFDNTSKSEYQERHSFFNGLTREELLQQRHGRDLIDLSGIDQTLENYQLLKELIGDANSVAAYGDSETEEAYFEHVFREALEIDLYRTVETNHTYNDLVNHISAVNSELDQSAIIEARDAYRLNFRGDELYETE